MSDALVDRVLIFHNYADCPGVITGEPKAGLPILRLSCAECGKDVGLIDAGVLEQLLSLIPGAGK